MREWDEQRHAARHTSRRWRRAIDRAIYRLRNTNGLPLRPVGDDSDPEPVLHACNERLRDLASAACELASAIAEQVGPVRSGRLTEALGRVFALLH